MKSMIEELVPTELVPLPSRGIIYPPNHPFHNLEYVPIRGMNVKDEDILLNVAFRKMNATVSELIKSCVMLPGITSLDVNKEIIAGDVATILYAIRINSYGSIMDPPFLCPNCKQNDPEFLSKSQQEQQKILMSARKLNIELNTFPVNILELNPIRKHENRFLFKTKKTLIEFKFLSFEEQEYLNQMQANSAEQMQEIFGYDEDSSFIASTYVTSFLEKSILSINGKSDELFLKKYIRNMRLIESQTFRNYISKNEPTIHPKFKFHCDEASCGYEELIPLPINQDIFTIRPEHKTEILLEPFFILSYYAGFTWSDYLNFPVRYKKFYIERINEEINKASENKSDIPTKSPMHNSSDIRAMTGKVKTATSSAKLQRFT